MADNVSFTAGVASYTAAADEVTYSGDNTKLQLTRLVHVSGTEATKIVAEIASAAGTPAAAALSTHNVPMTSGGYSAYHVKAAASTNAAAIKASPGQVFAIDLRNFTAGLGAAAYDITAHFYDKASAPTVGSDTVLWSVTVNAGQREVIAFPHGLIFTLGIAVSITKGAYDNDNTAVAVGDGVLNVAYK
jgi:hypothetical protein